MKFRVVKEFTNYFENRGTEGRG